MSVILKILPAPLIRYAGRLQWRVPLLRRLINSVGQSLAGEGVIQRGAGKGLYFDATGCNPGFLAGTSEPLEQELLMRYARPGRVVYDLGANAGYYVVIAARAVGPSGQVYAFEPTPEMAARIRKNVGRNGQENVEVVEAAVSDVDGEIAFGLADLVVSNSIRAAESGPSIRVRSLRLDTFVADDKRPPDLLLVDIEGAEIQAMDGAMGLIERHRPVIMVEVHWLGPQFPDWFRSRLEPLGYEMTNYEGGPIPEDGPPTRYHALLVPRS